MKNNDLTSFDSEIESEKHPLLNNKEEKTMKDENRDILNDNEVDNDDVINEIENEDVEHT